MLFRYSHFLLYVHEESKLDLSVAQKLYTSWSHDFHNFNPFLFNIWIIFCTYMTSFFHKYWYMIQYLDNFYLISCSWTGLPVVGGRSKYGWFFKSLPKSGLAGEVPVVGSIFAVINKKSLWGHLCIWWIPFCKRCLYNMFYCFNGIFSPPIKKSLVEKVHQI